MNILIIEDQKSTLEYLEKVIGNFKENWIVNTTRDYDEALKLAEIYQYHLFIIDYELDKQNKKKNGLMLGRRLKKMEKYKDTPVIFETAHKEYVFEVVNELNCIYYLTKPYNDKDIYAMMHKITSHEIERPFIKLQDIYGMYGYVYPDEILYVKSERHILNIYLPNTIFVCVGQTLETILEKAKGVLVRSHKSYLVNLQYAIKINYKEIQLFHSISEKNYYVPIGKKYRENFVNKKI